MAEVRFYQLSRDPVERVVPLLASKALDQGERLIVVSADATQLGLLSDALWARESTFLANGEAGAPHADRQPILLSEDCDPANDAATVLIADGAWRESAAAFERAILLFAADQTSEARMLWSTLSGAGHTLRIFKQGDAGGWREGR